MSPSALAPFRVRSFRFQWPADLATSWAFEMETLILGWYILIATGSVAQLVLFGALAWVGSALSPFIGLAADRLGGRAMLCATRAAYALLAGVLAVLTFMDALAPWHVFLVATLAGLVKPSDQALRNVLVAQTMQPAMLMGALGFSRTTSDVAKVGGALAGAGGVALIGMGPAYALVTAMYVASFALSLGVATPPRRPGGAQGAANVLADMQQALRYVWLKPELLGAFTLVFLVNCLAFPFYLGLLPYVAKEFYGVGQAGLGHLAASFSAGALLGSLVLGAGRTPFRAGRAALWSSMLWFAAVVLLGQFPSFGVGLALIFFAGLVQSFCIVPLNALMLRSASDEMRGRVMGMRVLGVWGLPVGLLLAGPVVAWIGFPACAALYGGLGLAATVLLGYRWRSALWERSAPANA